jgi:hypothetical protein
MKHVNNQNFKALTSPNNWEICFLEIGNECSNRPAEWIDFPRSDTYDTKGKFIPGNGSSYHLCRRRFDLADANYLRYKGLNDFDAAMHKLEDKYGVSGGLGSSPFPRRSVRRIYFRDKVLTIRSLSVEERKSLKSGNRCSLRS